jgi:hypothetical protein
MIHLPRLDSRWSADLLMIASASAGETPRSADRLRACSDQLMLQRLKSGMPIHRWLRA